MRMAQHLCSKMMARNKQVLDDLRPLAPLPQRIDEVSAVIDNPRVREIFDLTVARLDARRYGEIQSKYRVALEERGPKGIYKYVDVCPWIVDKIKSVMALGLNSGETKRVLDLGTGAGHFLAVCNALGHETIGLDLENELYVDLCDFLGVDRRTFRIEPMRPLPSDIGRFSVVTAFAIKFDALGRVDGRYQYWSLEHWNFFLDHLFEQHLQYPSRIALHLNKRVLANGERVPFDDVMDACAAAGAVVSRAYSQIQFDLTAPPRPRRG